MEGKDREENHLEHLVAEGMAVAGRAYLVACEGIVLVLLVAVVEMVVELQVEMEGRIEDFPVAFVALGASLVAYL